MKILEVLDSKIMADRIVLLKKNKTENTKALVRNLRRKVKERNPQNPENNKYNTRGAEDSFTSYDNNTRS